MTKMNVSEVEGEVDYSGLMKEFGISPAENHLKALKPLDPMYRRGIVFAQRDIETVLHAAEKKKKFAVLTGFNPSGPPHLGNLLFLRQALAFQQLGGDVFIPISNDETYVFKKAESVEKATQTAMEEVIPHIIALGFDAKKTKIFISTKTPQAYELAVKLSTKTTFSTVKAIFGFNNDTNPGQIFYTIMQSAHILMPQLDEFGGPRPTVVPIGIDQDPYMRLVRDMAERAGFTKPSSTYHKFMPGLQGSKMSGSKPETCIYLNESAASARKKIMRAFSGGAPSLEEHRKHGGNPDIDVACQYLYFLFEESDKKVEKIFADYRSGSLSTGDVKNMLADKVEKFLKQHEAKRAKAEKQVGKFLLRYNL